MPAPPGDIKPTVVAGLFLTAFSPRGRAHDREREMVKLLSGRSCGCLLERKKKKHCYRVGMHSGDMICVHVCTCALPCLSCFPLSEAVSGLACDSRHLSSFGNCCTPHLASERNAIAVLRQEKDGEGNDVVDNAISLR